MSQGNRVGRIVAGERVWRQGPLDVARDRPDQFSRPEVAAARLAATVAPPDSVKNAPFLLAWHLTNGRHGPRWAGDAIAMDRIIQDLRYGVRGLLRQPAFALTAILALALGIGANTAVFSVVYAVLLKPLPYPQPEGLVYIHDTYPAVTFASVSFPKYTALRDGTRTLEGLGAMAPRSLTLTGGGQPEQLPGVTVSRDFFPVMQVQPLYGRWFTQEEDVPNGPPVIVLGYALWQRRFASDPTIVGRTIL